MTEELDIKLLLKVLTALKKGNFFIRMPSDWTGLSGKIADTLNDIIEINQQMAKSITHVSRIVGREGQLTQRVSVPNVAGGWADKIKAVNILIDDLVRPITEMARVVSAVAKGDLSQTVALDINGQPLKGQFLRAASTANTMVDQLNSFASEVTRVAREVGTEGKLGGQAHVPGIAGTWKDLTDSVNSMAGNLTSQVRNIAEVTTAVARGDLSKKITVDVKGEILELKNTINVMVDQLNSFASEVTRVAREVGTEGKLGGQAHVPGIAGTWKDLTDSVNSMAGNLTSQVRNIAEVTTAVANGDLSKKITVDVEGEILKLKNTINVMVDQLSSFASEVTRVAREVGTEGKLGGQAQVKGVAGTWKDLTDSVNSMAGNLTSQVRNIAEVTTAVANGNLSKKITVDVKGEILELKDTINVMVDQLNSFASEVTRVAREVGTEGRLGGQAYVPGVGGTWKDLTDNVNFMASNLTSQVRNIADVTKAVAAGDLSKKITVDVKGEILELKNTINVMVDQLSSFASEVTRVAREVGTEGKLGGQAYVQGVAGTWKDLTDNVNFMAGNLTSQVRGIAKVVTAVANGDLKQKLTVEAKGEIASLADTINSMTDTLAIFADQVTTVAREVGVEGKLGGQAKVPGASGTWKGLTENVNQLAANLTTQVRAIAEVATAVTQGDLTRSISVEAQGEVAVLKDTINEMIRNLHDTTQENMEQDWLKTNLAKFSRMLQGQRDLVTLGHLILSELAAVVGAQRSEFYVLHYTHAQPKLVLMASYASDGHSTYGKEVKLGHGLVGQAAFNKKKILLTSSFPETLKIISGLVESAPQNVLVLPISFEGQVLGVIELASIEPFSSTHHAFLDQLTESIGLVISTIEANSRTESLLMQSQSLAQELQQTNHELGEKARLLSEQNFEVERKNREVEQAKLALEEKAAQLALSSKYKSQFLANMSHELRTPLNSLLILAQQLSDNPTGNLTHNQVEFAKTIYSSGNDLLTLINDILDLSKIESGTVTLDVSEYHFQNLRNYVERTFRHMAEAKGISFSVELAEDLPFSLMTDITRLQQVLKNLLSNAFKFTARGNVSLKIAPVREGWSIGHPILSKSAIVVAFSVTDTGVGITADKLKLIFEAFQQADGSTARKYGGTGLGLSISRELARLLNGEIRVQSELNVGSTFTLFLPYNSHVSVNDKLVDQSPPQATTLTTGVIYTPEKALDHAEPARPEHSIANPTVMTTAGDATLDDRALVASGGPSILIVEDDPRLAKTLLDFAHEKNFKGIVAAYGDSVLTLARDYLPTAILLDIDRPEADGLSVLDRLKRDPVTRHIPVHVLSNQTEGERSLRLGAISYLAKPVSLQRLQEEFIRIQQFLSNHKRSLLVVENDQKQRDAMIDLIGESDVHILTAETGQQALETLQSDHFDCMVLNPTLPDMNGFDLLDMISKDESLRTMPVVIYAVKKLERKEAAKLKRITKTIVVKEVRSLEHLLDETALFLHLSLANLPESKQRMLDESQVADNGLSGRQVLIVDDDLRNIFALSSVLEQQHMKVLFAENGKDGIEVLENNPSIEIVLMDIMMPEMDGYDTMQAIRRIPRFKQLPIITLTAKAMKGDREKCIAAGASDYITKPVDIARLLSVMRVWLHK
ncbi:HAMP domain-containing protein [Nitrosomonas communis]|uniref:HAMP domain-containing protein n=1 Tax=Nitrosomonas communis TaxID=44574 RepID=UPI001C43194A|nr:HAMP domain-containing protein [Nitrosomonas communis]